MKIKVKSGLGTIQDGDIVDAAVNEQKTSAVAFDGDGFTWTFYDFEVVPEEVLQPISVDSKKPDQTINSFFNQELKSISIEFK